MTSVLTTLTNEIEDAIRSRFCTNPGEMLDRVRWSFQNFPLALPSAPALISSLLPVECNRLPPEPPTNPIPGGQCPNVLYTVRFDRIRPDGQQDTNISIANIPGAITNFRVQWRRVGINQQKFAFIIISAPNVTDPANPGEVVFGPSSYIDEGEQTRAILRAIVRQDGQPDNCGNGDPPPLPPIPEPPPGALPPININIGGNSVSFSPSFTFAPVVDIGINNGVHIPVNINIQPNLVFPTGISYPIYLKLPDLTVNNNISNSFIRINNNPTTGGQVEVELPTDRVLIGIDVVCNADNARTISRINGVGDAPALFLPSLLTVRFIPPAGISGLVGTDVLVKTLDQFVPCPWYFGAGSFRILPQPGVTFTSTPVFADVARLVSAD